MNFKFEKVMSHFGLLQHPLIGSPDKKKTKHKRHKHGGLRRYQTVGVSSPSSEEDAVNTPEETIKNISIDSSVNLNEMRRELQKQFEQTRDESEGQMKFPSDMVNAVKISYKLMDAHKRKSKTKFPSDVVNAVKRSHRLIAAHKRKSKRTGTEQSRSVKDDWKGKTQPSEIKRNKNDDERNSSRYMEEKKKRSHVTVSAPKFLHKARRSRRSHAPDLAPHYIEERKMKRLYEAAPVPGYEGDVSRQLSQIYKVRKNYEENHETNLHRKNMKKSHYSQVYNCGNLTSRAIQFTEANLPPFLESAYHVRLLYNKWGGDLNFQFLKNSKQIRGEWLFNNLSIPVEKKQNFHEKITFPYTQRALANAQILRKKLGYQNSGLSSIELKRCLQQMKL
eukprot:g2107.t1